MPLDRLVIFDCDGVLVDSEPISNRILAADVTAAGWPMTTEDCIRRFKGSRLAEVQRQIEAETGRSLGADWLSAHYQRLYAAFRLEITTIPGAAETLATLRGRGIPFCVASQGPVEKMRVTLGATGLWPEIEGHVYSAEMVARPKPFPDLFLHAAASEGADPAACIVVEDSATGIRAAQAAGMTAVGLAAPDEAQALTAAGAGTVISRLSALADLIG